MAIPEKTQYFVTKLYFMYIITYFYFINIIMFLILRLSFKIFQRSQILEVLF
jgi:hypothetical protein